MEEESQCTVCNADVSEGDMVDFLMETRLDEVKQHAAEQGIHENKLTEEKFELVTGERKKKNKFVRFDGIEDTIHAAKSYESKNRFKALEQNKIGVQEEKRKEEKRKQLKKHSDEMEMQIQQLQEKRSQKKAPREDGVANGLDEEEEQEVLEIREQVKKTSKGEMTLEATMDSGASQSVAPPEAAPGFEVKESEGSRRGQRYVAASGDRIPNIGEQVIKFKTAEGKLSKIKWQNAPVTKPLLSVSHICDSGHEVKFTKLGGVITNMKSGRTTAFRRKNNVYVLDMVIEVDDKENVNTQVFHRPGGR